MPSGHGYDLYCWKGLLTFGTQYRRNSNPKIIQCGPHTINSGHFIWISHVPCYYRNTNSCYNFARHTAHHWPDSRPLVSAAAAAAPVVADGAAGSDSAAAAGAAASCCRCSMGDSAMVALSTLVFHRYLKNGSHKNHTISEFIQVSASPHNPAGIKEPMFTLCMKKNTYAVRSLKHKKTTTKFPCFCYTSSS